MYPFYDPYDPFYPAYSERVSRRHYSTTTNVIVESQKPAKKLGFIVIAPEIKVDAEAVKSMHMAEGRTHVVLDFDTHSLDLPPDYTFDEIDAALKGLCYYRTQWTDEVGDIEVCVLHKNNSEYSSKDGPFRRCLNNDFEAQRWRRMAEYHTQERRAARAEAEEQGEGSLGIAYEEPQKRTLWDRLRGI